VLAALISGRCESRERFAVGRLEQRSVVHELVELAA
jgi:hypothetical protein